MIEWMTSTRTQFHPSFVNRGRFSLNLFLIFFLTLILFTGCQWFDEDIEPPSINLSDTRFNGQFVFYEYNDWDDYTYNAYTFDGSNKVWYYSKWQEWSDTYMTWFHSGDYPGDSVSWYEEFEINSGEYRDRLWDNPYSDWSLWASYNFSDDGKVLTLEHKGVHDGILYSNSREYIKEDY